jgi:hypothetical protein
VSYLDDDQATEHECPTALERKVDEFDDGGQFWSQAGRWETIVDRSRDSRIQITLTTDRCVWVFWPSDRFPYLDGWKAGQPRYVFVNEGASHLEIVVANRPGYCSGGHTLASAHQIRGTGWQIQDRPTGGGDIEFVTVESRAKARSEMNRRARAHAKRIGLPVWSDKTGGVG